MDAHSIDEQLRFAITHKRLVEIRYHGRPRVAEPHDYGIKNGSAKLLVYQLADPGARGRKRERGWRLLEVQKIEACIVLEETFPGSRGRESQSHLAWDRLFVRVG